MKRKREDKAPQQRKSYPLANEGLLRQAADASRAPWRFRPNAISREREAVCSALHALLTEQGTFVRIVRGFYKGAVTAGFHVWLEGSDFVLDPVADAFGTEPIYVAHVNEAYAGAYTKD